MFLLRSAFWLTLAFIVMAPPHVDLTQRAEAAGQQAIAAGQDIIAQQILTTTCDSLECLGAKAALAAVVNDLPSAGNPMQDQPADTVPLPRKRPDWMG